MTTTEDKPRELYWSGTLGLLKRDRGIWWVATGGWESLRHRLGTGADSNPEPAEAKPLAIARDGVAAASPHTDEALDWQNVAQRIEELLVEFDGVRSEQIIAGEIVNRIVGPAMDRAVYNAEAAARQGAADDDTTRLRAENEGLRARIDSAVAATLEGSQSDATRRHNAYRALTDGLPRVHATGRIDWAALTQVSQPQPASTDAATNALHDADCTCGDPGAPHLLDYPALAAIVTKAGFHLAAVPRPHEGTQQ
ncbi:hypothetical protein [Amycolatopsis thermoflava]|uniref:hypothetical protein n=1 Tax=Amycolatopsis thermoflava TaxID=84480 RepID=UPI00381ECA75